MPKVSTEVFKVNIAKVLSTESSNIVIKTVGEGFLGVYVYKNQPSDLIRIEIMAPLLNGGFGSFLILEWRIESSEIYYISSIHLDAYPGNYNKENVRGLLMVLALIMTKVIEARMIINSPLTPLEVRQALSFLMAEKFEDAIKHIIAVYKYNHLSTEELSLS